MTDQPVDVHTCPTCGRLLPYDEHDERRLAQRLGDTIRRHRIASGMTQQSVSDNLNTALSRAALSRIELGEVPCDMVQLAAICAVIGVDWRVVITEAMGDT